MMKTSDLIYYYTIKKRKFLMCLLLIATICAWQCFTTSTGISLPSPSTSSCLYSTPVTAIRRNETHPNHLGTFGDILAIHLAPYDHDDNVVDASGPRDLTILPQELPGYTGWARGVHTLVDFFRIAGFSGPYAIAGKEWTVQLECAAHHHPVCRKGGSLFYVRAYGRSILPGKVLDHENGKYTVTIVPHDAGRYTLEVVLTFSNPPEWHQLPMSNPDLIPSYEGYLLKGFPLQFTVVDSETETTTAVSDKTDTKSTAVTSSQQQHLPICTAQQLMETSLDSALDTGRWLVVNKTRSLPWIHNKDNDAVVVVATNESEAVIHNVQTYIQGFSSIGFQMDYFPLECDLLPMSHFANPETWLTALHKNENNNNNNNIQQHNHGGLSFRDRPIHILLIGDSNTRLMRAMFEREIAIPLLRAKMNSNHGMRLTVDYINMMGPFTRTFPDAAKRIRDRMDNPDLKDSLFFVMFNLGLHDMNACEYPNYRKYNYTEGKCLEQYQTDVQKLIQLVQSSFPPDRAPLMVWQSTTAGWPKWGVYGVQWPLDTGQKFPKEPNVCAQFNQLAWPILRQAKIPIMDAYWLSLSRPDHRQVDGTVKEKLVHMGPEVYSVLIRKFCMMILETLEKGTAGQRYLGS